MSYVRNDSGLWHNLAGVVCAYQPVRAPGPTMARYNQALGGENRHLLVYGGSGLTWSAPLGFSSGGSATLGTITIANTQTWSAVIKFSGLNILAENTFWSDATRLQFAIRAIRIAGTSDRRYATGGVTYTVTSGGVTSGTMGIVGQNLYLQGKLDSTVAAGGSGTLAIYFVYQLTGYVQAGALYNRILSPAEVWLVSRQMQYCDTNPDWSAWGRRRQWYYMPAGFLAAWASNSNQYIGPDNGVSL